MISIVFVKAMFVFYDCVSGTMPDDLSIAPRETCDTEVTIRNAYKWAMWTAIAALCEILGDLFRGWGFGLPGARITTELRKQYYDAIMRQEIGWHDLPDNASGKLCAALASEVTMLQALTGEQSGLIITQVFILILSLTLAFLLGDTMVTLVMLGTLPIMTLAMSVYMVLMSGEGGGADSLGKEAGRVVGEVTTSIRTISAFTLEKHLLDLFSTATDKVLGDTMVKKATLYGFVQGWTDGVMIWILALIFWYGGKRVSEGHAEFEGVFIPVFCMFYLAMGMGQAENGVVNATKAADAAARVFKVIDRESKVDFLSDKGTKPATCTGRIELQNVHFTYPARPDHKVCNGYNLTVEAGKTVALCGASGSGKSTAIQLIERFYDPDQGSVKLDGVDVKDLNVRWLRQQIGLVSQEPVLFSGTIAENIGMGKPGASREEVIAAAQMANAHTFISEFPDGYDTDVGEKGGQLSGGQKQRVAIARAMIKDPAVLLLDEATSALDTESERVVQAALDSLLTTHKRTTIMIAHRLSTIRNADKICVVNEGMVVEEGTHEELMAKGSGGYYYKLQGGS